MVKLSLVMGFEGLRAERQRLSLASDRLSVRWYLGDDRGAPLPDAATLTRLRQRFVEQIVELWVMAGLGGGRSSWPMRPGCRPMPRGLRSSPDCVR